MYAIGKYELINVIFKYYCAYAPRTRTLKTPKYFQCCIYINP